MTLRPVSDNGEKKDEFLLVGETDGEINAPSGEINGEKKIILAIAKQPGIKREGLLLETKIPLRTIDRILRRLREGGDAKIEYRGSKKTGGWFTKS